MSRTKPSANFSGPGIASIAALKALLVSGFEDGDRVTVDGYYAPGDDGGGVFFYDADGAGADDGGTVIAPNAGSGRWIRVRDGRPPNVRWFGAKGDNVTNDAQAFTDAIAVAQSDVPAEPTTAGRAAGLVYIPKGAFHLSTSVDASAIGGFIGDGLVTSKIRLSGSATINVYAGAWVQGIAFTGDNQTQTGLTFGDNSYLAVVKECFFGNFAVALKFPTDFTTKGLVDSCFFLGCGDGATLGGTITTTAFRNCHFNSCNRAVDAADAFQMVFDNNVIEDVTEGLKFGGAQYCTFAFNWWERNAYASMAGFTAGGGSFASNVMLGNRYVGLTSGAELVGTTIAEGGELASDRSALSQSRLKLTQYGLAVRDNTAAYVTPADVSVAGFDAVATATATGGNVKAIPGAGSNGQASGNLVVQASGGSGGAWNTPHLVLGAYHLWVDGTGDLRIKSSAPTSDTDGTVVGTQT